jgi:hypothetical protein
MGSLELSRHSTHTDGREGDMIHLMQVKEALERVTDTVDEAAEGDTLDAGRRCCTETVKRGS